VERDHALCVIPVRGRSEANGRETGTHSVTSLVIVRPLTFCCRDPFWTAGVLRCRYGI